MVRSNYFGTLRKRGVIAQEIIKDGVNDQNEKGQQATIVNSEIHSSEDPYHKEASHVKQNGILLKN